MPVEVHVTDIELLIADAAYEDGAAMLNLTTADGTVLVYAPTMRELRAMLERALRVEASRSLDESF